MIKRVITYLITAMAAISFLVSCKPSEAKDANVQAVFDKLAATGYLATMIPVSNRDMFEIYGIETDNIKQAAFYMSENYSTNADEVAIFETTNVKYAKTLESILKARLTTKANIAEKYSAYEYGKIKQSSVVRIGNYVYFVVCDEYNELMRIMKENIG
ncbi:MAG: DUF4358 domain-containing protein [Christensenellaceae bacterium]|nr:DUF4358 domain-containing protein [Christensenellaceae bacterium]